MPPACCSAFWSSAKPRRPSGGSSIMPAMPGRLTLFDWLGVDAGVVVLGVVLMAVGAFRLRRDHGDESSPARARSPSRSRRWQESSVASAVGAAVTIAAVTLVIGQPSVERKIAWAEQGPRSVDSRAEDPHRPRRIARPDAQQPGSGRAGRRAEPVRLQRLSSGRCPERESPAVGFRLGEQACRAKPWSSSCRTTSRRPTRRGSIWPCN